MTTVEDHDSEDDIVDELYELTMNGNRKDVVMVLAGLTPVKAAYASGRLFHRLCVNKETNHAHSILVIMENRI